MALTFNPAVSGGRRSFLALAATYCVSVFAGALLALSLVLVATAGIASVTSTRVLIYSLLGWIGWTLLRDWVVALPVPYRKAQVPERLRDILPPAGVAIAFGAQLGTGFFSRFTYSTHTAMLAGAATLDSFPRMMVVLAIYAVGKSIALCSGVDASSIDDPSSRFRWDQNRKFALRTLTAGASMLVAISIAGAL